MGAAACISRCDCGIYAEEAAIRGRGDRRMKTGFVTRCLLVAGLAAGVGCGVLFAQTAGEDMKNAGTDTKNAAVDTGHATKTTTKKVYKKTKTGTKAAYHKTANGTKTAANRTANAGDAIAGKPAQHPSSTPPQQ